MISPALCLFSVNLRYSSLSCSTLILHLDLENEEIFVWGVASDDFCSDSSSIRLIFGSIIRLLFFFSSVADFFLVSVLSLILSVLRSDSSFDSSLLDEESFEETDLSK